MEIPLESRADVNDYIRTTFAPDPELLQRYKAAAKAENIRDHYISSEAGKLLDILVRLTAAQNILEIGTLWGYSTWWLYQGLAESGRIVTFDKHIHHQRFALKFFAEAGMERVESRLEDALEAVPQFADAEFDLIFLDSDKTEYPEMLERLTPKLRPGGLLIADNVLVAARWQGTVVDGGDHPSVEAVKQFNQTIADSTDWQAVPLAINAGLLIARKA